MNASETDIGLFDLEAARRLLVEKSGVRSLGFMRTITSSLLWCYYWRRYPRLRLIKKKITPDDPNGEGIFRPHRSIKAKDNLIATSTSDHDVSFICFPSNKEKLPMAADKLSLISSSGPPAENLREMNAYLGISFSMSKYFSRSRMKQYFEWAGQNISDLVVIVADHFEGYNFNVFKGVPLETAFDKAYQVGIQFATNYRRAIPPSLASRINIVLASELLQRSKCAEVVALSRSLAKEDPEFKGDVDNAILELLAGKLEDAGYRGQNLKPALEVLQQYIFEEIAIILYSAHLEVPAYPIAIFPYPPREVITKIYNNHYGGAFRLFTRGQPFRFVQVAPSGFEVLKSHRNESYDEPLNEADLLEPR